MRRIAGACVAVGFWFAACGGSTDRNPGSSNPIGTAGGAGEMVESGGRTAGDGGTRAGAGASGGLGARGGLAGSPEAGMFGASGALDGGSAGAAGSGEGGSAGIAGAGVAGAAGAGGDCASSTVAKPPDSGVEVLSACDPQGGVIAAEIDSECRVFKGFFEPQTPRICVNVTPVAGSPGINRVCFPPSLPEGKGTFVRCKQGALCAAGEAPLERACPVPQNGPAPAPGCSEHYCCAQLLAETDIGADGKVCAITQQFGAFAYAEFLDADQDLALDIVDNCQGTSNFTQSDGDHDAIGNACDNCPFTSNPTQTDSNHNGVGDECENGGAGGAGF